MEENRGVKLIFLDTNGVLNFTNHRVQQLKKRRNISFNNMELNSRALQLLGQLVNEHRALVVCTSSWRKYNQPNGGSFKNLIKQLKNKAGVDIYSLTPVLGDNASKSIEIQEWFNQHPELKVNSFVIIDDEQLINFDKNLVKCDRDYGLTKTACEEASRILSKSA